MWCWFLWQPCRFILTEMGALLRKCHHFFQLSSLLDGYIYIYLFSSFYGDDLMPFSWYLTSNFFIIRNPFVLNLFIAAHPRVPDAFFRFKSVSCLLNECVHRPANWPACRNDRFWHFSCAAPVIIVASCCFSVGCDLSLGVVPPPSVVQLADSDTCFNDSLFCMRSPWRVEFFSFLTYSLLSVRTPGMYRHTTRRIFIEL